MAVPARLELYNVFEINILPKYQGVAWYRIKNSKMCLCLSSRVVLEEDESVLMALKSQITKRRHTFKTAQQKVQTLKEQLAAAERIVKANVQQIQKFTIQVSCITCS